MVLCKLIESTWNHFEASIATKDFVKSLRDTLVVEFILTNHESLLLSWVQDYKGGHVVFEVERACEIGLSCGVKSHVAKGDSSFELARKTFLNTLDCLNNLVVGVSLRLDDVDDAENSIFLKADVIGTLFAQVRHWLAQPWLGGGTFNGYVISSCEDESLRVNVNEFEEILVREIVAFVLDRFLLLMLQYEESWVLRNTILSGKYLFR